VGSPRASCCVHKLQELNSLVKVQVHSGTLTEDVVSRHDVVVMTVPDRDQIIRWNEFCRNYEMRGFDNRGRSVSRPAPIRFICVAAYGVMGAMFSDFGPEFVVSDKTGEPPVQRVIPCKLHLPRGRMTSTYELL
jgi:ubiquitin-activating enzyme E1